MVHLFCVGWLCPECTAGKFEQLVEEISRLTQPGPCGKHPEACLGIGYLDKIARGGSVEVCLAGESEKAAEQHRDTCPMRYAQCTCDWHSTRGENP